MDWVDNIRRQIVAKKVVRTKKLPRCLSNDRDGLWMLLAEQFGNDLDDFDGMFVS